ncbi:MAG: PTS fructose transporter subunit IIA [Burkholderiales bacterium]
MNSFLIIAHAPLAHAFRQCALHVFPDVGDVISALDVQPNVPPDESLAAARIALANSGSPRTLILTDVFGATPCNVAQQLVDGPNVRLIAGVNLPMLLRALSYRGEALDEMVQRALAGGTQGVMQVANSAPQNQTLRSHDDQDHRDHQQ